MRWVLVAALALSGCSRCAAKDVPDAGAAVAVSPPAGPKRFSTDLRSVLLTVYPEYRGTDVKVASAKLTRSLEGAGDWAARARALFAKNKVTEVPADGGVEGTFDLFHLRVEPTASGATASIELPVDGETLGKLYGNPNALSTMQLGLFLPREDVTISRDVFDFHLEYVTTTERRASFLTRQLVELMQTNLQWKLVGAVPEGWQPNPTDGGYGEVPEQFTVKLVGVVDGAEVTVTREVRRVTVHYRLVTFER
jgi:hypothetical protein